MSYRGYKIDEFHINAIITSQIELDNFLKFISCIGDVASSCCENGILRCTNREINEDRLTLKMVIK